MKTSNKKSSLAGARQETGSLNVAKLASLVKAHAPYDGIFELRVPGVHAVRRSKIDTGVSHGLAKPALCIVGQGAKSVMLGPEVFEYNESNMIVFSVDVPITSQITRASHAEPFLGLKLDLDPQRIADLALKVYPRDLVKVPNNRAIYLGQPNAEIINAAIRLIEQMSQPEDAKFLGPLVVDEILIRLLRSPVGARVAQIGLKDSGVHGVAKAVNWLRDNFTQPIKIEKLAALANMSLSTFHTHFKSVTSMSPLQYQKVLRLQEARRLMLSSMTDAGLASRQVGYISASQFSREYGRFFGGAPSKDIAKLRGQMVGVGEA